MGPWDRLERLLERDAAERELSHGLRDCLAGRSRVLLLTGPAASGKTTLLRTVERAATQAGAVVLSASVSRTQQDRPMGVIHHLIDTPALGDQRSRLTELVDAGALSATIGLEGVYSLSPEPIGQVAPAVLDELADQVRQLADETPIVITLDDIEHADAASRQFLVFLARRARASRLLVVLTEDGHTEPAHRLLVTDLLRLPHCTRLTLDPLSPAAVATMIADRTGAPAAATDPLVVDIHRISAGNPMLARALVLDVQPGDPPSLAVGDVFRKTVIGCLSRCQPPAVRLAEAVAVLGDDATTELAVRLAGLPAGTDMVALESLRSCGLLADDNCRHSAVRLAILDGLAMDDRARLHADAARLLHEQGATAAAVAPHVSAARLAEPSWTTEVLAAAADTALHDGDVRAAIQYLRDARGACVDRAARDRLTFALAKAEWMADPAAVIRHLPAIVRAMHTGGLTPQGTAAAIGYLLWHGQPEEVALLAQELDDDPGRPGGTDALRRWLARCYPGIGGVGEPPAAPPDPAGGCDIVDDDLDLIVAALTAMIDPGGLERANRLLDRPPSTDPVWRAPTGRALLNALRAATAYLRGEVRAAHRCARRALTLISPPGWGIAVALPLSTLVLTSIAAGRHDDAASYISLPVPAITFRTPCGLHYLRARGALQLAIGNPHAALADFAECGSRMRAWGLDSPHFIPWRLEAARAHLALDAPGRAERLIVEQLARLDTDGCGVRGNALRLLAATREPTAAADLLAESVAMLRLHGGPLELACALADLGRVQRTLGAEPAARRAIREAHDLAGRCGADALSGELDGDPALTEPEGPADRMAVEIGPAPSPTVIDLAGAGRVAAPRRPAVEPGGEPLEPLSDAEHRVAILAAGGDTNRVIAAKLFVTASTVEQHLTRVYRKLRVTGRHEIAAVLGPAQEAGPTGT